MDRNRKKVFNRRKKKQKLDKIVKACHDLQEVSASDSSSNGLGSVHNLHDLENSDVNSNLNSDISERLVISSECDKSEEELVLDTSEREIKELQEWIVENNVPHSHVRTHCKNSFILLSGFKKLRKNGSK
jgi:hypothetical protein